jgi:hypothetical protein
MLIYIDKEFAIAFEKVILEIDPFEQPDEDNAAHRILQLFKNFPDLQIYSDAAEHEKKQIRLLRMLLSYNPVIRNFDQFQFEISKSNSPLQLLAFTIKRNEWADAFEQKGGLYFTIDDYLQKISNMLQFEKSIRFMELKKPFNWTDISYISKLPAERAFVIDNYWIDNKIKRQKNLYPLLRMLSKIKTDYFVFEMFMDESKLNLNKHVWSDIEEEIRSFIEEEDLNIEVIFKKYNSKKGSKYNFHDRKLFLKYIKIEVGKGFDLLPYNQDEISDKKIIIRTIFDKDTYDDFRNYYLE